MQGQGVHGLQVDTEPRGRRHAGNHTQPEGWPEGSKVIACSAHDNAQLRIFWGFGDTQVYADGVLALNVDDLVLPDRRGVPWHMRTDTA